MATATFGSESKAKDSFSATITINLVSIENTVTPFEISPDETLGSLIDKVKIATRTEFHVGLYWDGRELSSSLLGPRKTANANNQFSILWHNRVDAEIELSDPIPDRIQQLTGVKETRKCVKVSTELFGKLKVSEVCDINHTNLFGVLVYTPSGKRATATKQESVSLPPPLSTQSSLTRALIKEGKRKA